MGNLTGFGMVSTKILDFALQCGIVLLFQGPIYEIHELHALSQQQLVFGGDSSMVLPNWASVEGARVDGTATTVSGEEFGEGSMQVV